jgi:hypothetical protein
MSAASGTARTGNPGNGMDLNNQTAPARPPPVPSHIIGRPGRSPQGRLRRSCRGLRAAYVFYESGLSINEIDPKKRAVGFKLFEGMEVPAELASRFKFARQKSKLAGTIRGPTSTSRTVPTRLCEVSHLLPVVSPDGGSGQRHRGRLSSSSDRLVRGDHDYPGPLLPAAIRLFAGRTWP